MMINDCIIYACSCVRIRRIYNCFQPLMVCLSLTGTLKQMKRLAKDYDAKVVEWAHNLTGSVKV